MPRSDGVTELAEIPVTPARSAGRGAAHEAFAKLFALPFDSSAVLAWKRERADVEARSDRAGQASYAAGKRREELRRTAGWGALAVGGAAALAAGAFQLSAYNLKADAPPGREPWFGGGRATVASTRATMLPSGC